MPEARNDWCTNCGKPLRPGARFCPGCGTTSTVAAPVAGGPPGPPPGTDPAPQQPSGHRKGVLIAMIGAVVILAIAVGITGAFIVGRDKGSDSAEAATDKKEKKATTSTTSTTVKPTTTTTQPPPTTTTTQGPRSGLLNSTFAKVRLAPAIDEANEIATIEERRNDPLTILEGPTATGWYLIDIDGIQGWIFGAFILPPAAGQHAAETLDGELAILRTSTGEDLYLENPSGDAVLVTGSIAGPYWMVLLPDGGQAYVAASDMRIVQ